MKKLIPVLLLATIAFYSCIKEYPAGPEGPLGADSTGLLKKMVTISWPDSQYRTIQEFAYNINGSLLAQSHTAGSRSSVWVYKRDPQGRIRTITAANSQNNWDSTHIHVYYVNNSSSQVAYLSDSSAVFQYNTAGKISRTDGYMRMAGGSMKRVVYHLYTYDGSGNMTKREEYTDQDDDGVFTINFTYRLEYDTKVNPQYPIDDALINDFFLTFSPNNVVKQMNDPANPNAPNDENISVYDFRPDNKPHTLFFSAGDGRQTRTYYYYY